MTTKPLVSVINIFFNAEKYFVETIESVIAQTYDNWELLLVDDGSTDKSTQIALDYAAKYPEKIRYLQHPEHKNVGKSSSRNLGINNAKGDYIALLDADDIFLPPKFEKQVAILESHPEAGMVYGPTLYWYSWTGNKSDQQRDSFAKLGVEPNNLFDPPTLLTLYLTDTSTVPTPCGLLARRDVIVATGGFDERIQHLYEDQVFFAKLCLKAPVFIESGSWDKYRQHLESSSNIAIATGEYDPVKPNPAHKTYLHWLEEYISTQNINDPQLLKALDEALVPYRYPLKYINSRIKQKLKSIAKRTLPGFAHRWIGAQIRGEKYTPPVGAVDFGSLRRLTPISRQFGFDRGLPVDRYYIEKFLAENKADIKGRVLEIGDNSYTRQFGGDRVTQSDVLHIVEGNPQATIVGDLSKAENIPSDAFDCLVLTQTLQMIYDVRSAVKTIHRILKPGGVALVTIPGISHVSEDEWAKYWSWNFTSKSGQLLFAELFPEGNIQLETHGNVLAAIAFLQGIATVELDSSELDHCDRQYEVIITVRAIKE